MNLFEAGALPGIPIGGIIGGILCKSFGTLATLGGVFAGMIAGGFLGWLYAFLILFLLAVFATLWNAACKRPKADISEEEGENLSNVTKLPIAMALISSTIVGFKETWTRGLVLAGVLAVLIALLSVVVSKYKLKR